MKDTLLAIGAVIAYFALMALAIVITVGIPVVIIVWAIKQFF